MFVKSPRPDGKPFAPWFEQHIAPLTAGVEKERQSRVSWAVGGGLMMVAAVLIYLAGASAHKVGNSWDNPEGALLLMAILFFGGLITIWVNMAGHSGSIKASVYPAIFAFFGSDFRYIARGGMDLRELGASDIVPYYDRADTSDHVIGSHQGVQIELMQAHLEEEHEDKDDDDNRRVYYTTCFCGLMVRLSMNKNFNGHTVVVPERLLLKGARGWLSGNARGKQRVKLEDPIFERSLDTWSTDQVEARYLLTPSFMERVNDLGALLEARTIRLAFYHNQLLLLFEPRGRKRYFKAGSVFNETDLVMEANTILQEMGLLFSMVEHLKLHQPTGL